jgi:hypothetical protein
MIKLENVMLEFEQNPNFNKRGYTMIKINKIQLPVGIQYEELVRINDRIHNKKEMNIQISNLQLCKDDEKLLLEEGLIITIKQLRDILNKDIDDDQLDLEYIGTLLAVQNYNIGKLILYKSGISFRFLQFFTNFCVQTGDMEFDVYIRDMLLRVKNIIDNNNYDDDEEDELIKEETLCFDEEDVDLDSDVLVSMNKIEQLKFSVKTEVIIKDPSVYYLDLRKMSSDDIDIKFIYCLQIYFLKIIIYKNTEEYNILIQIVLNSLFNNLMAENFMDIYNSPFPVYNLENNIIKSLKNDIIKINLNQDNQWLKIHN